MNHTPAELTPNNREFIVVTLSGIVALTVALYMQAAHHTFVHLDDNLYVYETPEVLGGVTAGSVKWAFSTLRTSNYIPLTWLSLMIDAEWWGNRHTGYVLTNVLLHIANSAIVFFALYCMTGKTGPSAWVSAAFAVHPLHVESVVWVSERKDVLSTFFALVSTLFYVEYAISKRKAYMYGVIVSYFLSLLSKQMYVTLPFVFLLFDYWPLERFKARKGRISSVVSEKAPMFALTILFCGVAFFAQIHGGAVKNVAAPLAVRLRNAAISYTTYIEKTVWPTDLAVYYPHQYASTPIREAQVSIVVLLLATALFYVLRSRMPYLLIGWLIYLGTLVPVIGITQIGDQAYADRYMYFPSIGLFVAESWLISELGSRFKWGRVFVITIALVSIGVWSGMTWRQIGVWRNSETLFKHALSVTKDNYVISHNLAAYYMDTRQPFKAEHYFRESLAIRSDNPFALRGLSIVLSDQGRPEDAMLAFRESIQLQMKLYAAGGRPPAVSDAEARYEFARALAQFGRKEAAIGRLRESLAIDPSLPGASQMLAALTQEAKAN